MGGERRRLRGGEGKVEERGGKERGGERRDAREDF